MLPRCSRQSMNRGLSLQRTEMFSSPNFIITIIITTTTTAFIRGTDMDPGMDMDPMSWSGRDTGVIATTIITTTTTTTASIPAAIEAASYDDQAGPQGPVFLYASVMS